MCLFLTDTMLSVPRLLFLLFVFFLFCENPPYCCFFSFQFCVITVSKITVRDKCILWHFNPVARGTHRHICQLVSLEICDLGTLMLRLWWKLKSLGTLLRFLLEIGKSGHPDVKIWVEIKKSGHPDQRV